MNRKRWKDRIWGIFGVVCLVVILFTVYRCPIKLIWGIPCPGCGMTRAYIALFQLDFKRAFSMHALFPIPPFVGVYLLFRRWLPKSKVFEIVASTVLVLAFMGYWLLRIFVIGTAEIM